MKIISKIKFHPFFYLLSIYFIFTAHFKEFLTFMCIIFFHELGHILAALYFNWNIKTIWILPFGGMTEFSEELNRPIYEEFLIVIMGPIFQMLLYIFFRTKYHYPILFFNLLPIYPLDGSKILFLFCNLIISYRFSFYIVFLFSLLVISYLLSLRNILLSLVSVFFFIKLLFYLNDINITYLKFLFERYKNNYHFKKLKRCKNILYFKRDYEHYFIIDGKIISEREKLQEYFKKIS